MKTMSDKSGDVFTRRRFLANTSAMGAASLLGFPGTAASEPLSETKRIRLLHTPAICLAPQYLAEDLLHLEGFSEVEYVETADVNSLEDLAAGRADVSMWDAYGALPVLDAGKPVVLIGGIHAGCYELFATGGIHGIRDLKGKSVAVYALGDGSHILVASMLAYVGMNPIKDVQWLAGERAEDAMRLFTEGKADAFLGFPRTRSSSGRRRSGMSSSTRRRTGPGLSTSAACWLRTATLLRNIRSRQSGRCEPSSKRPTSAPRSPRGLLATWWTRATSPATRLHTKC